MDNDKDLERFLRSHENGYIQITPKTEEKLQEIIGETKNPADIAEKNYEYVRSKPYFISPLKKSEELVDKSTLDCGSKSVLLASLNRAAGIPSRITMMECPFSVFRGTIDHMNIPDIAKGAADGILDMIGENARGGTHYAVESYYDDEWHLMDPTMNPEMCEYFTGEKKDLCLSKGNASAMNDCRKIGWSEDLPSNGVIIASITKLASDLTGATGITMKKFESDVNKGLNQLKMMMG